MNKVFLIGRLTRDPELRYTSNNTATATFSIAVNRNYTNQNGEREADFINIVVWRKQAENAKNYLTKGSQIAVDGRIQTRSYDGQDGQKRYVTEVVADNIQFLDSRNGNTTNQALTQSEPSPYDFSSQPSTSIVSNQTTTDISSTDPFADFGSSIEISDDELPF